MRHTVCRTNGGHTRSVFCHLSYHPPSGRSFLPARSSCPVPARVLPGSCPAAGSFLQVPSCPRAGSCPVPGWFLPGSCPIPARFLPGSCPVPARQPGSIRLGPRAVAAQEPGSNRPHHSRVLHHACADGCFLVRKYINRPAFVMCVVLRASGVLAHACREAAPTRVARPMRPAQRTFFGVYRGTAHCYKQVPKRGSPLVLAACTRYAPAASRVSCSWHLGLGISKSISQNAI
jgi:hypothetical protein